MPNLQYRRLSIIVPYRDRAAHLAEFTPALAAFFAAHAPAISYTVTIIEQEPGLPFNRGSLLNVGFALTRGTSEYVCLHDVDYIPVQADYSWADIPTPIIWHGAERRPIAPGRSSAYVSNCLETFFGAVVLVPNALFARVDGLSNGYWGWGYEDVDLQERFRAAGVATGRRKGSFRALDHDNAGFAVDLKPTAPAQENERRFKTLWWRGGPQSRQDGLSTLNYELVEDASPHPGWRHARVRLRRAPPQPQLSFSLGPVRLRPFRRI